MIFNTFCQLLIAVDVIWKYRWWQKEAKAHFAENKHDLVEKLFLVLVSVLLTFNAILFALSHWTTLEMSKLILLKLKWENYLCIINLCHQQNGVFSYFFIDQLKLFMYIRKNKDPRMEPWGTPYLIVWISDL